MSDLFEKFHLSFTQVADAQLVIAFKGETPVIVKSRYGDAGAGYWRTHDEFEQVLAEALKLGGSVLVTIGYPKKESV